MIPNHRQAAIPASPASDGEQIDTVAIARKWLQKNPKSCRIDNPEIVLEAKLPDVLFKQQAKNLNSIHDESKSSHGGAREDAGRPHAHGSERCITAFLGDKNWSQPKVHRLLALGGIHDDVKAITSFGGDRVHSSQLEKNEKPSSAKSLLQSRRILFDNLLDSQPDQI